MVAIRSDIGLPPNQGCKETAIDCVRDILLERPMKAVDRCRIERPERRRGNSDVVVWDTAFFGIFCTVRQVVLVHCPSIDPGV